MMHEKGTGQRAPAWADEIMRTGRYPKANAGVRVRLWIVLCQGVLYSESYSLRLVGTKVGWEDRRHVPIEPLMHRLAHR